MESLLVVVAAKAVIATLLAVAASIAARFVRRPGVVHAFWLIVLLELIAPPVLRVGILPPRPEPPLVHEKNPRLGIRTNAPQAGDRASITSGAVALGASDVLVDGSADLAGMPDAAGVESPVPVPRHGPAARPEDARWSGNVRHAEGPAPGPEPKPRRSFTSEASRATRSRSGPTAAGGFPWAAFGGAQSAAVGALAIGWGGGALIVLTLAAARWRRFRRQLAESPALSDEMQERARVLASRMGLPRCPTVRMVGNRIAPMVGWRLGRLEVFFPEDLARGLSGPERDALLAHELAHVSRRDHLVRFVELAAASAFWWHPVSWWARRGLRRAEERACDERVLQSLPGHARAYARAMIETVEFLSVEGALRAPVLVSGLDEFTNLKERLTMILDDPASKRPSRPMRWALAAGAAALILSFPTWAERSAGRVHQDPDETPAAAPTAPSAGAAPSSAASSVAPLPARAPHASAGPLAATAPRPASGPRAAAAPAAATLPAPASAAPALAPRAETIPGAAGGGRASTLAGAPGAYAGGMTPRTSSVAPRASAPRSGLIPGAATGPRPAAPGAAHDRGSAFAPAAVAGPGVAPVAGAAYAPVAPGTPSAAFPPGTAYAPAAAATPGAASLPGAAYAPLAALAPGTVAAVENDDDDDADAETEAGGREAEEEAKAAEARARDESRAEENRARSGADPRHRRAASSYEETLRTLRSRSEILERQLRELRAMQADLERKIAAESGAAPRKQRSPRGQLEAPERMGGEDRERAEQELTEARRLEQEGMQMREQGARERMKMDALAEREGAEARAHAKREGAVMRDQAEREGAEARELAEREREEAMQSGRSDMDARRRQLLDLERERQMEQVDPQSARGRQIERELLELHKAMEAQNGAQSRKMSRAALDREIARLHRALALQEKNGGGADNDQSARELKERLERLEEQARKDGADVE